MKTLPFATAIALGLCLLCSSAVLASPKDYAVLLAQLENMKKEIHSLEQHLHSLQQHKQATLAPPQQTSLLQNQQPLPFLQKTLLHQRGLLRSPKELLSKKNNDASYAATQATLLQKLNNSTRIDRQDVIALLKRVPGLVLNPEQTANAHEALLVFTQPDCPFCVKSQEFLASKRKSLLFPVVFVPLGNKPLSMHFYAPHPLKEDEEALVKTWLKEAEEWFVAHTSSRLVPQYLWITTQGAAMATLSQDECHALLGWLNATVLSRQLNELGTSLAHAAQP